MQPDRLIFENQQYFGQVVVLSDRPLVIGRANDAGLSISHESVSRRHARLTRVAAGYQLEDLGSSNGTFVNEVRLTQPVLLANGDRVRLGTVIVLRLELAPKDPAPGAVPPPTVVGRARPELAPASPGGTATPAPYPLSPAHLAITTAEGETIEYDLVADEITLGRQNENDLVIKASIVSRRQFSFRRQGVDYQLVIRPTAVNPVFVNNEQVRDQLLLKDGDVLCIGYVGGAGTVVLRYQAARMAAPTAGEPAVAHVMDPNATIVRPSSTSRPAATPSPAAAAMTLPLAAAAPPAVPAVTPPPVAAPVAAAVAAPVTSSPAPAPVRPVESHPLFRQRALDRLNSPDQLNELLAVTSPLGWLALLAVAVILLAGLLWGVLGSVRLEASGQGVLTAGTANSLEAVLFLTPADAQQVRPGMVVQITPVTINKNEYGALLGVVTSVGQGPATEAEMLQVLGTDSLVANRVAAGAVMKVRVQLRPDTRTASGYAWTSVNGPPATLSSGTLCAGVVTIAEQRPIALVWGSN